MLFCRGGYLGYPPTIQTWLGGYPIQTWSGGGVLPHHPDLVRGGTPSQLWMVGGTWGTPTIQMWSGVPWVPLGPEMGYPPQTWDGVSPLPRPGMGYPPHLTWDGVPPPHLDLRWGTPYPDLIWGTPPPPASVDWHTKWKYYMPPSFGYGR